MVLIESNIKEVIKRVDRLRTGIPERIAKVIGDESHWRSRARSIAAATLYAHAGENAEMVPAFVDRVVTNSKSGGDVPELTVQMTPPEEVGLSSTPSERGGDYSIPLVQVELWRAAFFQAPTWVSYRVILDWISTHTKDLTVQDMPGELPGGTVDYEATARKIYNIIFRRGNTSLLDTESEVGPHAGGGGARLLDFFAAHPLTSGLVPASQAAIANEWLSIVLAAWREALPEEVLEKIREEIAKI